jgi:hypothetical protein
MRMGNVEHFGSCEGRFCGVLAAAIARLVTASGKGAGAGRAGAVFRHYSESGLELATRVLSRLALAIPAGGGVALAMDAEAMPSFLATRVGLRDPRLEETVAAFIAVACYYGDLPDERTPFRAPAALAEAMRALAPHGDGEACGDHYRWTERIGPAMRACYLWTDDGPAQPRLAGAR